MKPLLVLTLIGIVATFTACDTEDPADLGNLVERNITNIPEGKKSVFVYTRTAGDRNASMPEGVDLIRNLGASNDFHVNNSEDPADFTFDRLSLHDGLVLLNTQGDIFDDAGQDALVRFVENGGNIIAVHAAIELAKSWAWYGELIGARSSSRLDYQRAKIIREHDRHPSMLPLGPEWFVSDNWYNFSANPRNNSSVVVLATLDESSIMGGEMGDDHPIVWAQRFSGSKVWYTGLGHDSRTFANGGFQEHLLGGIVWAIDHFDRVPE